MIDRIQVSYGQRRWYTQAAPLAVPVGSCQGQPTITRDPEFVYFTDRLDYYDKILSKTLISLNESVRKKDREAMEADLLAIENKRRKALGEEPIESLDDLIDEEADGEPVAESEEAEAPEAEDEPDPFTREAVNIAADLVLKTVVAGR